MYSVICYLIGENKYKQLLLGNYDKDDAIREYSRLLDQYYLRKDFVIVMLNNDHKILTMWALETPRELYGLAKLALKNFQEGKELVVDETMKLENVLGSQILEEVKEEAKKAGFLKDV